MKKAALAVILALCLMGNTAWADISFSGTVEASSTVLLTAPVSGTVEEVLVREGETVTPETVIARIRTTKVYAPEDGTVTAVFGQPGDETANVAERYGAVMYLEGTHVYTISSASTSKAYEQKENYIVHSGETVYAVSRNHTLNKGTGVVTAVDGSSFSVLMTSGEYYVGDSYDICRDPAFTASSRIGRGNMERISPIAVTGTGSIVSFAVSAGASVKRGQLLFETVESVFDGLEMTGTEIKAGTAGVIASLSLEQGGNVTKDSAVAVLYPENAVRVAAQVAEADLRELKPGQKVKVELDWNQDLGVSYEGRVEMISALGTAGEESTTYPVYVTFRPDENTRYGMTALVTTLEQTAPAAAEESPEGETAFP